MQQTAGVRRGPKLQVGHLLIWVVGCAIVLAERRSIMPLDLPTSRARVLVFGASVAMSMALGTMLAGCGLLAYRRWRGDPSYPSRAGHWILLRGLVVYTTGAALWHSRLFASALYWNTLLIDLAFFWCLRRRLPRHWVAAFLASFIAIAIQAFGFATLVPTGHPLIIMSLIGAGAALLEVLATLWAISRDRRSSVPTDGLHRLGIGTLLAIDCIQILYYFSIIVR
jgi:hypothetical protein